MLSLLILRRPTRHPVRPVSRPAVVIAALLALLLSPLAQAQERSLQSIDFVSLDSNRLLLTLSLSAAAPDPTVFTIDKPARLSLDLADTRMALAERYRKINIGRVRAVAAAEAKGRTRVVVELAESVPYSVKVDGAKIFVELVTGNADASSRAAAPVPPTAAGAASPATPVGAAAVRAVDFRRGEKGEGRIVVSLADPQTAVDVKEESGKVVARFKNAPAADRLLRRLDVLDFATPVKFIDVSREGINTVLTVTPVAGMDFEQVAYQSGSLFTLELQPLSAERIEEKKRNEPLYTGERISLSFQSVDIRSLLQIIADVAGTNMVVSDSVSGEIAMRLQNVPWDQALDIILRTKGLGVRQQGNVMLVAPMGELADREKSEAEAAKARVTLSPLRSEIIQINYAKASEVAALLKSGDNSLMTERGRVTVDERTNSLLVLESREKLLEIRALMAKLDIPVRQVLIESRIVVATDDYSKELGARFGATSARRNGNNGLVTTTGSGAGTNNMVNDFLGDGFPVAIPGPGGDSTPPVDRYNVNLPAAANAGRIAFALLGSDYLLDLELSALQEEGRGEVRSNPRVITSNGKQASIEQGVEIPYQQSTSSGATSVTFKKAVLSLKVLPQITPDEKIIMDLEVNNDSVGETVNSSAGPVPSIDTRKITNQVMVDNGQTVVLGGIYQQTNRDSVSKVPFFGDLPILGAAFRFRSNNSVKAELLIFITPKIITDGLKVN